MSFPTAAQYRARKEGVAGSCGPWAKRPRRPRFRSGCRIQSDSGANRSCLPVNASCAQTQTGAARKGAAPVRTGQGLATRPRLSTLSRSAVVDVDVDAVRNVDVRRVTAQAKLAAEKIK